MRIIAHVALRISAALILLLSSGAGAKENVLIIGGAGNTGSIISKMLIARGDDVTAFVRSTTDRFRLEGVPVNYVVGDAMKAVVIRYGPMKGQSSGAPTAPGSRPTAPASPTHWSGHKRESASGHRATTPASTSSIHWIPRTGRSNSPGLICCILKRPRAMAWYASSPIRPSLTPRPPIRSIKPCSGGPGC